MTESLEKYEQSGILDLKEVQLQMKRINEIFKEVMDEGVHYGIIPGTKKPSLYKPGAEKINFMSRLGATYTVESRDLPEGHREVIATCTLTHIPTGQIWGNSLGSCSTMEGKYRFRTGNKEVTDKPVPQEYWTLRKDDPIKALKLIGGKGHGTMKHPDTGMWMISLAGEKTEHDNPADYHNTVLKMAQKRAMTSAVIGATAASDIFTVDLEDMTEVIPGAEDLQQNPKGEVIDAEVVGPDQDDNYVSVDQGEDSEKDWLLEEMRQGDKGKQASIPKEKKTKETKETKEPAKESDRIPKAKGNILYAKWKNIPDYTEEERNEVLKDMELKSVYDAKAEDFDKIKKHLDTFYKK